MLADGQAIRPLAAPEQWCILKCGEAVLIRAGSPGHAEELLPGLPTLQVCGDIIRHGGRRIEDKDHENSYCRKWKRIAAHSGGNEQNEEQRRNALPFATVAI